MRYIPNFKSDLGKIRLNKNLKKKMQLTDWVGMPTILSTGYCYTYLAISSLAVVVTIASTYYAYLGKVGQAELAWVAWLNTCEQ